MSRLPERLEESKDEIVELMKDYGLDFYPTIFEAVSPREMMVVAARDGFPSRYQHWRFGMEYRRMKTHFDLGRMRIYELVLNNDPSLAYMLNDNDDTINKMVMAHVYGHVDFFKNNSHFSHTDRHMIDTMANHRNRIKRYSKHQGIDVVDDFIDDCLSINNLIDFQAKGVPRSSLPPEKTKKKWMKSSTPKADGNREHEEEDEQFRGDRYMKWWFEEMTPLQHRKPQEKRDMSVRDAMLFLIENAPLEDWEQDVLSMMRDETYYFSPQRQTKIMNEGWATYWHTKAMRGEGLDTFDEGRPGPDVPLKPPYLDFADSIIFSKVNSGVLATSQSQLNPYKLGVDLYRDIEERWNRGLFGKEYDEEVDLETRLAWDTHLNEGREFLFVVREVYNDYGFLNRFLTKDFCRKHKLFVYDYNPRSGWYEISDKDWLKIKSRLLNQMTNAGEPIINIVDDNYKNRKELYLLHEHLGPQQFDLKLDHAIDTMKSLHSLWRRPVHLETIFQEHRVRFGFDGEKPWVEELEDLSNDQPDVPEWM